MPRPATVTVACVLFWLAALLMIVQATFVGTYRDWMHRLIESQYELLDLPAYAQPDVSSTVTSSLTQTAVSLVLAAAFWVVIPLLVYRGKSWARIVVIVFGVFGGIVGPLAILLTIALAPPPAVYLLTAVPSMLAVLAGMVLVWRRPAKDWFAALQPARP